MRRVAARPDARQVAQAIQRVESAYGVHISPVAERYAIERAAGRRRYPAYRAASESAAPAEPVIYRGVKRMESKPAVQALIAELRALALAHARLTPAELLTALEREALTATSTRDRISALNILLETSGLKRQVHEHHSAADPAALVEQLRATAGGAAMADAAARMLGLEPAPGQASDAAGANAEAEAGAAGTEAGVAEATAVGAGPARPMDAGSGPH